MPAIHKLATTNISTEGLHSDGGNLYLQVSRGRDGAVRRSWVFRYQVGKRTRDMGLGSLDTFGLSEARDRARSCRQLLADGVDPIEHRKKERARKAAEAAAVMTFDQCAEAYQLHHRVAWSPIHAKQWASTLSAYASPVIGAMPVAEIATAHVNRILDPIWSAKPETANRVRGRIEAILDWATVSGFRAETANPARWKGYLDKKFKPASTVKPVRHQTALPYAQMPAFMVDLRLRGGVAALALEFTILTAVRSRDVLRAKRAEVDRIERVWTIPVFSKTRAVHKVPLSDAMIACLDKAAAIADDMGGKVAATEFCFFNEWTGAALSVNAMLDVLKRMGRKSDLTPHGCRSSFRDWAAEETTYPSEVCEMALGHTISDKVVRAYKRGDLFKKRIGLMQSWADYLAKPAAATDGNVVAIGARRP